MKRNGRVKSLTFRFLFFLKKINDMEMEEGKLWLLNHSINSVAAYWLIDEFWNSTNLGDYFNAIWSLILCILQSKHLLFYQLCFCRSLDRRFKKGVENEAKCINPCNLRGMHIKSSEGSKLISTREHEQNWMNFQMTSHGPQFDYWGESYEFDEIKDKRKE